MVVWGKLESQSGVWLGLAWHLGQILAHHIKLRAILNWVAHINRLGTKALIAVLDRETHH
jgi:hypothetical protein